MRHRLAACLALSAALVLPRAARAVPAFARKTGLPCSACHEVWPRLNDFGVLFRDRGYRLGRDRDAPVEQHEAFWPLAMRTTAGYQWMRNTLVPIDITNPDGSVTPGGGTTTTQTGTLGFTGLDVFAAGNLGEKVSFLLVFTPGLASAGFLLAPSDSDLESAWVGLNDLGGTGWLNLRAGKHATDQPIDEHRTITLTQGYNVYHFHPQSSLVTWEPGANQVGLELFGHSELGRLRYSVSVVNENDAPHSNNFFSTPVVWAHLQASHLLEGDLLAAIRGGVFGSLGWHPTRSLTLTAPDGTATPVTGTDFRLKQHRRLGAEAHLQLFSVVNPLTLSGVVFYGSEDAELFSVDGAPGTRDGHFFGGFAEAVYTYSPRLSFIGRWERIRTTQTASDAIPDFAGNLNALTGAIRYTFELSSRTEAAVHIEVSNLWTNTPDPVTGANIVPETLTGMLAFDVAL